MENETCIQQINKIKTEHIAKILPSTLCIFDFIDMTVSNGDTVISNAVPVSVSIYSSIVPSW
jgi:hypothetical protein